jgi:maltose O-acetyltransferase
MSTFGKTVANILASFMGFPSKVRVLLLRISGVSIGKDVTVLGGILVKNPKLLTLGDQVFLSTYITFDGAGKVDIEAGSMVAAGVKFLTTTHEIGPAVRRAGRMVNKDIVIGTGCWIGANAIIFPGVSIGAGSVVGAGAVVNRSCDPNTLLAGVPAKIVKMISP